MKFRTTLFIALISLLLAACNMTLAQDVAPPPGAVQQAQPQPTLGPVFPAQAPDLQNGAAIYAEKCAGCHGEDGLARRRHERAACRAGRHCARTRRRRNRAKATPADWYQMVTLGNIENFMPPFASLSDQERWDVVAYAQSLSTTSEQVSQGEGIFQENCADCPTDFFTDQEQMAALSTDALVSMLADGGEGLPALG